MNTLVVDLRDNTASLGDLRVRLTAREAEALSVLHENAPKTVSSEYLEACVVGLTEEYRSKGWAYKLICRLRKTLAPIGVKIRNHNGVGYFLELPA